MEMSPLNPLDSISIVFPKKVTDLFFGILIIADARCNLFVIYFLKIVSSSIIDSILKPTFKILSFSSKVT